MWVYVRPEMLRIRRVQSLALYLVVELGVLGGCLRRDGI